MCPLVGPLTLILIDIGGVSLKPVNQPVVPAGDEAWFGELIYSIFLGNSLKENKTETIGNVKPKH